MRWLLLLCLLGPPALGQPEPAIPESTSTASEPRVRVRGLGRAEGLPSAQTHAVAEGARGRMWFAGPNGLARYDGREIVAFGRRDGLSTQGLRSLAAVGEKLFVGTPGAGSRFSFELPIPSPAAGRRVEAEHKEPSPTGSNLAV